ncbi:MAG: hypothetical protein U9N38_05940 [Thermodesulfobacteriota bacterium]|nr:hypothetical protein [Thermodesulfobacteriota bacterium]
MRAKAQWLTKEVHLYLVSTMHLTLLGPLISAFGIDEEIVVDENNTEFNPQEFMDRVTAHGGLGFISRPDHEGSEKFHVKHFPWRDWSVSGYTEMVVWGFMINWQLSLTGHSSALLAYLFPPRGF